MTRIHVHWLALIITSGCAVGGDVDAGGGVDSNVPADAGGSDAARSDGGDGSTPACATGELVCGGACIDPSSDSDHCGGCDSPCGVGQSCDTAGCACDDESRTLCGTTCADFETDAMHCGGCSRPCGMDEECFMGGCLAGCATGETRCGTDCADTTTDPTHCGGCAGAGGAACAMSEECLDGACVVVCAPTETRCGTECANTSTSPAHCGGCAGMGGSVCASGEICAAGICRTGSILIYSDSFPVGIVPAELAAIRMGIPVMSTTSDATFSSAFDAGSFSIVVVDIAGSAIPAGVRTRTMTRITAGLPVIFAWWDLDTDAALATALGVSTATYSVPRPLHPRAGASVNLFASVETFPVPLTSSDDAGDNGDVLTILGSGEILISQDSPTGATVAVRTNSGRTLVQGFLPYDYQRTDNNSDGVLDMAELYVNEYTLMLAP